MQYLQFQERETLELVDEYQLYCFYLQDEILIGQKYPTPDIIRTRRGFSPDKTPSFVVFAPTTPRRIPKPHEFLWKEHSLGLLGDIFDLVRELYGFQTRGAAIRRVCEDFGLGGATQSTLTMQLAAVERRYADPVHIQIKSKPMVTRDLLYWDRYNIDQEILSRYFVKSVSAYWLAETQEAASYPSGLGYAYEINGKYQLYFPYHRDRAKKFRMNWGDFEIPGLFQLGPQRDLLIITKSMKDVMCLRSFGYDAIACKGENSVIIKACMDWVRASYAKTLILFDNDGKHKADAYTEEKIWIPKILPGDKDISDFTDNHGPRESRELLLSLCQ